MSDLSLRQLADPAMEFPPATDDYDLLDYGLFVQFKVVVRP